MNTAAVVRFVAGVEPTGSWITFAINNQGKGDVAE
ncbi:hypothetical protein PC116_g12687 [Phytophthora cactorum]|nr:hypothetical protein PC116_g12687 [Phytophthora cactorum]